MVATTLQLQADVGAVIAPLYDRLAATLLVVVVTVAARGAPV
jgi:hypothetical protein